MKKYKPKHSKEEYYDLIIFERVEFSKIEKGRESKAFACCSQHVVGRTPEECLDIIWGASVEKKNRIKYYKTLPTLEDFLASDVEIDKDKMYDFKVNVEDACYSIDGASLIKRRKGEYSPGEFKIGWWRSGVKKISE